MFYVQIMFALSDTSSQFKERQLLMAPNFLQSFLGVALLAKPRVHNQPTAPLRK